MSWLSNLEYSGTEYRADHQSSQAGSEPDIVVVEAPAHHTPNCQKNKQAPGGPARMDPRFLYPTGTD